jgi:flagellar biosynthesis/type III secretory pathway protein FliH
MNQPAKVYSFPSLRQLLSGQGEPNHAGPHVPPLPDAKLEEAIRKGYEDGLIQGRIAATAELDAMRQTVREQAVEAGRVEGLAEADDAAAAMTKALALLEAERRQMAQQVETFSVDLALAIVSRLVEVDSVRADFVARQVARALKALAPQRPQVIYVNPADRALLGRRIADVPVQDDEALARGTARVEAGSLFVEGGIEQAFEQLKGAVLEVRARQLRKRKRT